MREDHRHDADAEQEDADIIIVERRMAGQARDEEIAGDHGEMPMGILTRKIGLPIKAEEIGRDQQAAQDGAADRGEAGRKAEQREGLAALLRAER